MSACLHLLLASAAIGSGEVTRFAVIGDFGGYATGGSNATNEAAVAALVNSWYPEFIVTTGDNNYENGGADTIDQNIGQFYHQYIGNYTGSYGAGSPDVNRFFPTLGNHDYVSSPTAQPYIDYFTLPGNEYYYDFTWGPLHFFMFDTDGHNPDGNTLNSVQGQWLKNAVSASTSPWKIVVLHHPPYNSGQFGNFPQFQFPYADWGADMVLAGHAHDYERSIAADGVTYTVNGLGGKGGTDLLPNPNPETVVRFRRYNDSRNYPELFPSAHPGAPAVGYGAQFFEVTDSELKSWFITANGTVIDSFVLRDSVSGDLDDDGFVGVTDLNLILGYWNRTVPPAYGRADPSGDGFVGIEDLNLVLGNWNAGTPPTIANPEPTSLAMLFTIISLTIASRQSTRCITP